LDETQGCVIWLTGLSGSGKSTIAKILESRFRSLGLKVECLDGDELRKAISPDVGFSRQDRELHCRRVTYISGLLAKNGIISIAALVSPYKSIRKYARENIQNFVEVWVKCSLDTCIKRDPKKLYKNASEGKISNMTGLQDPYEPPTNAEVVIDTETSNPDQCAEKIMNFVGINCNYIRGNSPYRSNVET
jgi:adenylylsulfate kinase